MNLFTKTLVLSLGLLYALSFDAHASNIKPGLVDGKIYPLDFKVVSSQLLCPKEAGKFSCKALGSVITIKAVFNSCIDQARSFDYITYQYGDELVIDIEATAIEHPMASQVRCAKQGEFIRKIHVINENFKSVKINNILTQYTH